MSFRDSLLAISPPFLLGPIGSAVQFSEGESLDAIGDWMIEGVEASMPGVGTNDSLYLIGRDMGIDRGPNETNDHYIARLQKAVASHRIAGNGEELLRQLFAWFSPSTMTPVRLVTNQAVWHEIDTTTEVVTKTNVGTNWSWDAFTSTRWFRGWVVIDSSAGPWHSDGLWGDPGLWGDGGVWGSDASVGDVAAIRRIIDRWKPAHISCINIIVTYDNTLYLRTNTSPPNPNGISDTPSWQATQNASFWDGVS